MEGLVLYICITIIPWIGLTFRIYDISKGNFDPKEDPKTLTLLSIWAIGFTIFWILIGATSGHLIGRIKTSHAVKHSLENDGGIQTDKD